MKISEANPSVPGSPCAAAMARIARLAIVLPLLLLVACGNKGPLYIEVDQEALEELEDVQKDIDESAKKKAKANDQ